MQRSKAIDILRAVAVLLVMGAVKTQRNWFIYSTTYLLGALVFGIVMAALIEFQVLRLRDRLFPSRGHALNVV